MERQRSANTKIFMKTITVELKFDLQQQQLLQQAAANWGFTLQEYLQELALNSIPQSGGFANDEGTPTREKIELDANDAEVLNSCLNNPPVANATLKRSIVEHQQKYGQW
jgi:uncharacterized protein (DUF1778 family)